MHVQKQSNAQRYTQERIHTHTMTHTYCFYVFGNLGDPT